MKRATVFLFLSVVFFLAVAGEIEDKSVPCPHQNFVDNKTLDNVVAGFAGETEAETDPKIILWDEAKKGGISRGKFMKFSVEIRSTGGEQ